MEQERVKVEVVGVFLHEGEMGPQHFVLFRDAKRRRMPIWIGQFEAWAIVVGLEEPPERPFTHDAMLLFLAAAGATIEEVYIHDLRDETFYATARLGTAGGAQDLDIRPSDAAALAVRVKCPIFVSEAVMQSVQNPPSGAKAAQPEQPAADETPETWLQRCQSRIARLGKTAPEAERKDSGDSDKTVSG